MPQRLAAAKPTPSTKPAPPRRREIIIPPDLERVTIDDMKVLTSTPGEGSRRGMLVAGVAIVARMVAGAWGYVQMRDMPGGAAFLTTLMNSSSHDVQAVPIEIPASQPAAPQAARPVRK